jgi:polysaccharide deacetylase 2 family uncharacterized protein YibQ
MAERTGAFELWCSISQTTTCRRCLTFLLFSILISLGLSGCKNRGASPLSPAEVHEITHKMMRAAAPVGQKVGDIESHLQFDGVHPERVDHLFVSLPAGASDQAHAELSTQLIQSLDRIATANYLTRDADAGSGALVRLDYRRAGVLTHSIHIVSPMRARVAAAPSQGAHGSARLAIILDDLGADRATADAIFALPYPLTISVLPNHAHSTDIAEDAHRRGLEVMLHLPMQSVGNETPEAQELRPGMNADDVPLLIDQMMKSVPNAAGVNNHQGSQATADPVLMGELMPVLREWKLFYVDSRTTAATVAYDTAQHDAVRCAFRNVPFLDDVQDAGAIRKQLELAIHGALKKGEAIAIGHPHPATLQALREVLPQAEARGVRLVFASELVH